MLYFRSPGGDKWQKNEKLDKYEIVKDLLAIREPDYWDAILEDWDDLPYIDRPCDLLAPGTC